MSEAVTLAKTVNLANGVDNARLEMPGAGRFRVCDLVVESTVPLPELTEVVGRGPDCCFKVLPAVRDFAGEYHWFRHWSTQDNRVWLSLAFLGEDYLLRFPAQGEFLISRDGKEVQCQPLTGTPQSTIRHLFLDQVIPRILSRREPLVLHASAILAPEGAIAFVGKSGQGKSTLATCFGQIGCPLISDDYLVLRKMAEGWTAIPSYPGVRLWPQVSNGIFDAQPESTEIAHYTGKRRVIDPALVPFVDKPASVRCLYFLEEDGDMFQPGPSIVPVVPREVFMRLVACAFNLDIRDKTLLERQFDAVGDLTAELPCFQLHYVRDFSILPAVRRLIVDHQTGMNMALKDHLKVADEVLTTRVGDETVLLNMQTGMYHSLDPVGTRFLELLRNEGVLHAVHRTMLDEFDVTAETLETDLVRLSQHMLAKGLLVEYDG
jgi:Coenzyme PQQ synthesis protein D (PqqD)